MNSAELRNSDESPAYSRLSLALGSLVTASISLFYLLLFWNRFPSYRSGAPWFTVGIYTHQGLLPYKDYFLQTPPLSVLRAATVQAVFGNLYITFRAFGVFEHLLLSVVVFAWLSRMFRINYAALGAFLVLILSTGDIAETLEVYNHDSLFFGVMGGWIASLSLQQARSNRGVAWIAISAGLLSGLSFCAKHTIGAGITFVIPFVACLCLWRLGSLRKACTFLVGFVAGWMTTAVILLFWLFQLGIITQFFEQIFVQAPVAKAARLTDFLVRQKIFALERVPALLAAMVAVACFIPLVLRAGQIDTRTSDFKQSLFRVWLLGLMGVGLGAILSLYGDMTDSRGWEWRVIATLFAWDSLKSVVYFSFCAVGILSFFYFFKWLGNRLSWREAQICLFAAVSFSTALTLSLSWPIWELMLFPGLGLLVAAAADAGNRWQRQVIGGLCVVFLALATCAKMECPHGFEGFNELPVRLADTVSALPEMKGFVLPRIDAHFIDETVRIIKENTLPGDTVYSYPELILFNGLTGRGLPTFVGTHNMDLVNDEMCKQEAMRLWRNKPAVLIYFREGEERLRRRELWWRMGKPSGNRYITAACEALARQYRLAGEFDLPEEGGVKIMVFVRPRDQKGLSPASSTR